MSESNLSNVLAFLAWSRFNSDVGTFLSFLLFAGGIRKRDGLEVLITGEGGKLGWGKGETTAVTANFKSVSAILAPTLLDRQAHTQHHSNSRDDCPHLQPTTSRSSDFRSHII